MITNISIKIKYLSQKTYEEFINLIPFHKLTCSCGISCNLVKHAYYTRSIKTPNGLISLQILRVKCNCCGRTHAILPECIVPYSQVLLNDQIEIIAAYNNKEAFEPIMMSNLYIDEGNIKYIIKNYISHWREMLSAFFISMDENLSYTCLCSFKRQFMQIKRTPNIAFSWTHITLFYYPLILI